MINNNNNINNNTYNKVMLKKLIYFDGYNTFNLVILKNIKEMFIYLKVFYLKILIILFINLYFSCI